MFKIPWLSYALSIYYLAYHLPDDYSRLLEDLNAKIRTVRLQALSAVNAELLQLYRKPGKEIISQQENRGRGTKVIAKLADDLKKEFPDM